MSTVKRLNNISEIEEPKITIEEKPIQQLSEAVKILLDKIIWYKHIHIRNKTEERERFKQAREKGERFRPDFKFDEFGYDQEKILQVLDQLIKSTEKITQEDLQKYGAKEITAGELQEFFTETFQELKLYVKLASNVEKEDLWRKYSEEIWPMINKEVAEESIEKLGELQREDSHKTISPEKLREMFEEEIERLGMNYTVEKRKTSGCKNIPEDSTVVVAEGENGDRMYSEEEAKMLTMHELFHAVRAYNGFKAGKESGFPEILGLHSPFYDRSEEGGALYREEKTGTAYENKEFDYHLRLVAAYEVAKSDDFKQDFQEIVEGLIDLGGTVDRSFYLVTRNREILRHHIYQAGRSDWEEIEDKERMLIGKLNEKWAEKFSKETGGMLQEPEIGPEKLFDFQFNS